MSDEIFNHNVSNNGGNTNCYDTNVHTANVHKDVGYTTPMTQQPGQSGDAYNNYLNTFNGDNK